MASKRLSALRKRLNWVVQHNSERVVARYVPPVKLSDLAGECLEVETVEQLEKVAGEIPPSYPVARFREAIGQGRILLLLRVRAPTGSGPGPLVGFRVCERGRFQSLGLKLALPETILFTHYSEVFQEFRGRRYAVELGKCAQLYAVRRGMTVHCGTVATTNTAALKAHIDTGYIPVVATMHRVAFCGGRFVWLTPAAKILKALAAVPRPA